MKNRGLFSSLVARLQKGMSYIAGAAILAGAMAMTPAAVAAPQDMSLTVQLSTPLTAGTAHKGDALTLRVTSPPSLGGDTMQGKLTQVKSGGGQAMVQFTLDSIRHNGLGVPITAQIQGVSNAKGQQGADDQGQLLTASNIAAKAATQSKRSRFGGQLGGLIGGTAGEVTSDASDDTSANKGSAATMQIAAQGSDFQLGPGFTLMLSARSTAGPNLASLTPNAPPAVPTPAVATTAAAAPVSASAPANAASPAVAAGTQPIGAGGSGGQPELKATKIEFISGEKTVFFDDFSDMVEDEPPPHWKVRNGTVELRTGGGMRELYSKDGVELTSGKVVIPVNFTFELDWTGGGEMAWHFKDKDDQDVIVVTVRGEPDGMTANTTVSAAGGELGHGGIMTSTDQPVHFALWAQQGRVRAYLNGERIVDANQVEFGPMDHIFVNDAGYRPNGLRSIRVAESAPDFSTVINASGKYVTHGINFDTDSDRLKPESSAVLKQIAAGLGKNPNLKLEIDGYTDSVGDAAHNLDLSKRRASAVQTVLVSQFGIDPSRLASNGFGAAKPIGSNDTPDGRAENRRVEFLKK